MPLKHFTETFLVVLLGVAIAAAGLLTATLPPLPDGAIPWVILFALSLVYPLVLTPLFQIRRADNAFRLLHWFPAVMLLVWLTLQLTSVYISQAAGQSATDSYIWGWTMGAVVVGIILLMFFCLKVIRRRLPRVGLLLLLLVLFVSGAMVSERGRGWEGELASVLWSGEWWSQFGTGGFLTGTEIAQTGSGEKNLEPSTDPEEEAWREQLRMQQRREERIQERMADAEKQGKSSVAVVAMEVSSSKVSMPEERSSSSALSGTGEEIRSAGTMPDNLPSSGFDLFALSGLLAAGYTTTVHARAKKRMKN